MLFALLSVLSISPSICLTAIFLSVVKSQAALVFLPYTFLNAMDFSMDFCLQRYAGITKSRSANSSLILKNNLAHINTTVLISIRQMHVRKPFLQRQRKDSQISGV